MQQKNLAGMDKKISFITTLYNEACSVVAFLETLLAQTRVPDEIVIVDGGSNDGTADIITGFLKKVCTVDRIKNGPEVLFEGSFKGISAIKVISAKGARISEGRNIAIENSTNELICVSDAGCILADNWVEEITCGYGSKDPGLAVAGGYNYPYIKNFIQACLAVCVMPRKSEIKKDRFMPSSRNISFLKDAWQAAGGYPVNMDYGEDMKFNFNIAGAGYKIRFNPGAEVYWDLRSGLVPVFRQFFRYAKGDAIGRMYPARHLIRFSSLFALALIAVLSILISPWFLFGILPVIIYFMYKPYFRINPFLNNKKVNRYIGKIRPKTLLKVAVFFTIPLMMTYIEAAKIFGYLYGIAARKNF
jgi:glycosyltransferase involved in cell wall biosynthesis